MINLHREKIKFLSLVLVIIITLTIVMVWFSQWYSDYSYNKKYPTKESVVEAYIEFAVNKDREGIISFSPPDYDVGQFIDKKIKLYDGKKPEDLQIKYESKDIVPSSNVTIEGFKVDLNGQLVPFKDEIIIKRLIPDYAIPSQPLIPVLFDNPNGRWYIFWNIRYKSI